MSPYIAHDCKHCGGPIIKRGHEASSTFNRRKFCTTQCAGLYRAASNTYKKMRCQVCSVELIKNPNTSLPDYSKRKTCNTTACKSAWKSRRRTTGLMFKQPLLSGALMAWGAPKFSIPSISLEIKK